MRPATAIGEKLLHQAAAIQDELRINSVAADANSEMTEKNIRLLQESGIAAAFVPEELGGAGLTSVHDWLLLIAKLAQGDGSAAIAINMHLGVTRGMATAYTRALASGHNSDGAAAPLKAVAAGKMLICATATERGTDNLRPQTEAVRREDGWQIDGQKLFVTMSPMATHVAMNLKIQDAEGDQIGTTMLPMNTAGIEPQNDWQALGMRGSGSQSLKLNQVQVPDKGVRRIAPWGRWSVDMLVNRTLGNLPLVAAFLGIAEHAHELALAAVKSQSRAGEKVAQSPGVQQMVGELDIEMRACRSVLQTAGRDADDWLMTHAKQPPSIEAAHELMQMYQAAKWVINRGAITIVDRAMDLSGGGAFMNGNVLSQLYRDVRAGPFMQPHSPMDIRMYVGQVALEEYPAG